MKVLSNNDKYLSFLYTVVFVLLFYFNNETLPNNLNRYVSQPCMLVAIFELGLFIWITISRRNDLLRVDRSFIVAFFFILFVILGGLMDTSFANGYFLLIMNIMVAVTMVSIIPYKIFIKYFIQIVVLFAASSLLITYILKSFIYILPLPHVINSSNIPFINAYLCYTVDYDGYMRNTGIFREPGVWGTFLSIALLFLVTNQELFSKKTTIYFYVIIVATVFSTFSTTSIFATFLIYAIFILKNSNHSKQRYRLLLLLAVLLFLLSRNSIFMDEFAGAVNKFSTNSSSYQYRTEIMKNAIPLLFSNPFGLGIINGTEALTATNTLRSYHNTSTFVAGGVYFGILFLLIYIVALILFCRKRLGTWIYFIPITLLLQGEQYIFNPWFYMLIFYGIKAETKY